MRKRSGTSCPVHKYGIYSLLYKSCTSGQLGSNENNTELLMTRVKGISQKVDTMRLNEEDQTDSNQLDSLESYENGNKTITPRTRLLMAAKDGNITPPTSASDNDNDVTETEEDSTTSNTNSTFIVSRRRKSPTTVGGGTKTSVITTTTSIRSSAAPTGGGGGGIAEITLRRTPPLVGNGHSIITSTTTTSSTVSATTGAAPLYSEKKLKKPSTNYEPAALQRPTIASTVKMTQAAIDKAKAQTQGDKLNQIKAMRRQHNSRSGGSTG